MQINELRPCIGILLAGGLARRLGGGDKGLLEIGGRSILERTIACLMPQLDSLVLNANGDPARFAAFGIPVASDRIAGFPGPLAGLLTGMEWAAERYPLCRWVLTAPTDCPFLPADLVARLAEASDERTEVAMARSSGRQHPVVGLWRIDLREKLRAALVEEGLRKVGDWTDRCKSIVVDFETTPCDPFFNVNTPEDLALAERLISAGS
ncbi:molybdenum cofactor guanylyltransferase MobA [Dongia soli]|uniref:Molybdenum cofactor guanylyltransferase n=1 Tax=Dongia soli TaxID=600628 RepID=A0ABU5E934_9PROT|nr:molybdenum cofactor guanylyltransferase MobA [Dongia soli]MDY0882540.1 molybdenum cofactor guanylyltransferase MobA [Dongia soli]